MQDLPTIQEQAEFYDRWNARYRLDNFDDISAEIRSRGERILAHLDEMKAAGWRILEVGCGTGWMSERLKKYGDVTAIDLSPKAIEIARSHDRDSEYIAADFLDYDFGGRVFDAVICVETLFYVEDQRRFVRKLADLCREGGLLAVSTINSFVYARSRDVLPPEPGQIRNWLTRRETRALLGEEFAIDQEFTIHPLGEQGILRLVNSYKLNVLLNRVFTAERVTALKERCGFGGGVIFFCHKPSVGSSATL